jgi:hypothetical protein
MDHGPTGVFHSPEEGLFIPLTQAGSEAIQEVSYVQIGISKLTLTVV